MQDSLSGPPSEQGSASTKSGSSERRDGPKLKTQLQTACRRKGYALSTERTYWRWVVRYVRHHARVAGGGELMHPRKLGAEDVQRFLSYLATGREVSTRTQGQALNALVFLCDEVLETDLGDFERGKPPGSVYRRS